MKALIVYDSVFGNTEKVAQAMGTALADHGEVVLRRVGDVQGQELAGIDVLLVGSPTRAFSPTPAMKAWVKAIAQQRLRGVKVAAFDTRIAVEDTNSRILPPLVKVFGYAAKPISEGLRKKGGEVVLDPEGFFVQGTEGPVKDGELERAAEWARKAVLT
jgi:flavodoxin I